jgi:hypothetical protein
VAQSLGIVSGDAIARFRTGGDVREELSDELVSGERRDQRKHRRMMADMKSEDDARDLSFARAYGETLGEWSAGIVNFTGKILGKAAGAFIGNLGPYGALAIAGVVVVGGVYAVTQSGAIKRAIDATK